MRSIRNYVVLAGGLTLAACGGETSPQTVGSVAPPSGGGTPAPTDSYSQFVNPVEARSYTGIGGVQVYEYTTDSRNCCDQQGQIYSGEASTVRNSEIAVAYDPRSAIFTLTINDPKSGAAAGTRFQDPAARTNFGGAQQPQWGVPNLNGLPAGAAANPDVQYLQAGDGDPRAPYSWSGTGFVDPGDNDTAPNGEVGSSYTSTTLFYEKPGTNTRYVSLAGYVRNALGFEEVTVGGTTIKQTRWHLERGAFAYGVQTSNGAVPTSGSGSYSGNMLATMVYNPTFDGDMGAVLPTYFQWLSGRSNVSVNFATGNLTLSLAGIVLDPYYDYETGPQTAFVTAGSSFTGSGTARIDLAGTGGFIGSFADGGNFVFTAPAGFTFANGAREISVNVAGSSIDGAFFGPNGEEIGGGFRVVGGIPDQRVDILGAFTGKR